MEEYYDSFDCEVGCEEYYGEDYDLWEEEQVFQDEMAEDAGLDSYWEGLTDLGDF